MDSNIQTTLKFEECGRDKFLRRIYYHGFCDKKQDLPEMVHHVQNYSEKQVEIEYIGDVYIVTGWADVPAMKKGEEKHD